MTTIKASSILASKLSKNNFEQLSINHSNNLVLLNYVGWKTLTYKNIKKDISNIDFKLIDLKLFYVLNENKEKMV